MSGKKSESELRATLEGFIKENGVFTAFSVHLGEGVYTREGAGPDRRLRCFVQAVADLAGKPLDQLRVLDLACLEGHYAIEFALHGARAVGIELREANISKARFLKEQLELDNVEFYEDDVRNLSVEKYGRFDVVLCAGLLYHLDSPAIFEFLEQVGAVCDRLAIFETYVSLNPQISETHKGKTYWGAHYIEHEEKASKEEKYKDLWASIDNPRSFWFTQPSLCNILDHIGFTSFYIQLNPSLEKQPLDRHTYIAIKGQTSRILSSPPTDRQVDLDWTEHRLSKVSGQPNAKHRTSVRLAKKYLPQPVKDVIKKTLQGLGLRKELGVPDFNASLPKEQRSK